MFRSNAALAELYPSLLQHSMTTFSRQHVMRFLGKMRVPKDGVDPRFNGEVSTRLRHRPEGVCVNGKDVLIEVGLCRDCTLGEDFIAVGV